MNGPASSAGNASGIAARVSARASMYSAYPPSKSTPVTLRCTHMAKSPRRHWAQTKQCPPCQPTPTRCPGLQVLTLSPTASMCPAISCPGTRGYSSPGQRPSLTNTSLWQMPHASTFTRTCPARGSGITRSTNSQSPRGFLICAACIVVVIHAPLRDACRRGTARGRGWVLRTIGAQFPLGRLSFPHCAYRGKPQLFNNRLGDLIKPQVIMAEAVDVLSLVGREAGNDCRSHRIAFIDEFLQHAGHVHHMMKHHEIGPPAA